MRPRGIAIATIFVPAAAFGLLLGVATNASADQIAEKALPVPQTAGAAPAVTETVAVMPVAAVPTALPTTALPATTLPATALPATAAPAVGPAAKPAEAQQRGERRMIFSYILLRGLQGAGPFSGR